MTTYTYELYTYILQLNICNTHLQFHRKGNGFKKVCSSHTNIGRLLGSLTCVTNLFPFLEWLVHKGET